jgi:hypothetical protein
MRSVALAHNNLDSMEVHGKIDEAVLLLAAERVGRSGVKGRSPRQRAA